MTFKLDLNLDFACKFFFCKWLLGFFLWKETYWQHQLLVWTLWTLLSPLRYYTFLHWTLETALQWNRGVTSGRDPGSSLFPGHTSHPWTQAWIPQSTNPTMRKGKDTAWESTTCPSSSHKEPSVQLSYLIQLLLAPWFDTNSLWAEPAHGMGNARGASSCVRWAQALRTAWCCYNTEPSPLFSSALDKLLLSPGAPWLPVESSWAPACAGTETFTKGEYNKHSLTATGNRKKKTHFQGLCL